ncbi:MAG: hypothetical protein NTW50_04370 [Candidatus Berkelbacteria bacterium]|nr:hypothetical protein [Candidatus Berkelbacteria bacterium]
MDYGQILKRSWEITKKYRYLWLLGILAAWAEQGSSFSSYFPSSSSTTPSTPSTDTSTVSEITSHLPKVLGTSTSDNGMAAFNSFSNWVSSHAGLFAILILLGIGLYILIMWVANSAKAGIVLSVRDIEVSKKSSTFGQSFKAGRKFAWRLFGQAWLVALIMIAVLIGLAILVILPIALTSSSAGGIVIAVILGLFALLIFVACAFTIYLILRLASRALIIKDLGITASLAEGWKILRHHLGNSLILWVIEIGVSMGITLAMLFGMVGLFIILGGIGFGLYFISKLLLGFYVVIVLFALVCCLLVLSGALTAYFSTYWTIAYRALDHMIENKKK